MAFMVIVFMVIIFPFSSFAHHPGNIDKFMGSKERYFQVIDETAPGFTLRNSDGRTVRLSDYRNKIVILNFIYTKCPDVCPLHAEKIAEVQAMINATPMRDLVQFISVTTDPGNDTPDVMRAYGPAHGLDPANWSFLTIAPGQGEEASRKLAEAYGHKFVKTADGYQTHGVVTHIIDRGGRWAVNFHGLRFETLNMMLYINGLTNERQANERQANERQANERQGLEKPSAQTFWGWVKDFF